MSSTSSITTSSQITQFKNIQDIFKHHHKSGGSGNSDDGLGAISQPSKADQSKFLDKFTKDFGSDAAKDITNKDGSVNFDKMKDFFDKKLSANSTSGSDDSQDTDPMQMIMQMMQQGQGVATSASINSKMLERFTKDFGSDAAKSVTNEDGSINKDKLKSFMQEKMGSMGGVGGTSGANSISSFDPSKILSDMLDQADSASKSSSSSSTHRSHNLSKDESSKVLDKFTKDFGSDAAKSITNDDGTVNGDKLANYLQNKFGNNSLAQETDNTSTDFTKLLEQTYNKVSADGSKQNNILELLFGKNGGDSQKTGHLVDATA